MKYRYSLRRQLACLLALVINAAIVPAYSMPALARDRRSPSPATAQPNRFLPNDGKREQIKQGLFDMPLAFEANCGQAPRNVQFTAEAGGHSISISPAETVFTLFQNHNSDRGLRKEASDGSSDHSGSPQSQIRATEQAVVRMRLAGANHQARPQGVDLLVGRSNYFLGNDPARWHTGVPMYARVKEENVYPGIDLIYRGNGQHLEYDFLIASGGDPSSIKMDFDGVRELNVDSEGNLIVTTDAGEIRQQKPFAYQENNGVTNEIAGRYVIKGKRRVEFRVGEYDRTRTLVIDPVLAYSTYFGRGQTQAMGIAVDSAGNAYVLGNSLPTSVEVTPGAFQTASGQPIFVLKLNPAGNAVVYLSRFGGDSGTRGLGIAVDPEGNVFITGDTISDDYPTTPGAFQPKPKGSGDAFVTKLNPAGSALVYSTLIGGGANDSAVSIAIDSVGDAFIGGSTRSNDFPITAGALEASLPNKTPGTPPDGVAGDTGFIAKLNPAGSALVYSTYLGGEGNDSVSGLAVDSAGNAYVSGRTNSSNFPTTAGALRESPSIGFVAKLSANGSALAYSALTAATPFAIALDSSGNAYFAGLTFNDIPTVNAFQSRRGNGPVVKSLDGGNSWSLMDSGLPENVSPGIAIDPKTPSTLYAFASSAAGQPSIFKSMNAGGSWNPSATGLPTGAFIHGFAIDPVNPANLYVTAAPHNLQSFTTTVYLSSNSGSTWSPTSLSFPVNDGFVAIDPHTPSTVYAGYNGQLGTGSGAIFRSNDSGAHWQQLTNGLTKIDANALAIDPQNPSTLYLGTDQGLFKSSDRGDSWSTTIVTRPVQCLAIDPQTTATVYAGTPFALTQLEAEGHGNPRRRQGQGGLPLIGIIRSPNGGVDWAPMNIGLEFQILAPNYLLIDPKNPSTIYTSVRGGLFKTVDAAVNWTGPIGSQGVVGAIDPVNTLTLYAPSLKQQNAFVRKLNPQGSALVYSTYLGGLNFDEARGIAVDSQGNAYVGGITSSPNFPATSGSFQLHLRGHQNVFVTELSASGTLSFSTFLGGTGGDLINVVGGSNGLALDSQGNVYVAGATSSRDFPTASPLQASLVTPPGQGPVQNAFITKIDPSRQSTEPPPTPEALNTAKILSVTADGKNLQVEGLHFYEGSIIIVDGVPQNTLNDFTNLNTLLIGKKTAKRIPRGQSVRIQVQNLNGTTSDPFPFVRD